MRKEGDHRDAIALGEVVYFVIALLAIGVLGGCGHGPNELIKKSAKIQSDISDINGFLFEAKASERESPDEAIRMYQELIVASKVEHTFDFYQSQLEHAVAELQSNPATAQLSDEALLGLHTNYARKAGNWVKGWQGLARVHERKQDFGEARSALAQALTISRQFVMSVDPADATRLMNETYQSIADIEVKAGRTGKALVTNLSAQLLDEYMRSDAYREDQKVSFEAGAADRKVNDLIFEVTMYRIKEDHAQMKAVLGAVVTGLAQANAAWSQSQATKALTKSGGVMTPQAQMNAQMTQFQVQVFSSLVKMEAGQTKGNDLMATPLALPTFGRQLVDPQMAINSRLMIKTFAAEAATMGATPTLQQDAQQLMREVDGLPTFQTNSDAQVLTQRVGQFAEMFNAFVKQVTEVKKSQ